MSKQAQTASITLSKFELEQLQHACDNRAKYLLTRSYEEKELNNLDDALALARLRLWVLDMKHKLGVALEPMQEHLED